MTINFDALCGIALLLFLIFISVKIGQSIVQKLAWCVLFVLFLNMMYVMAHYTPFGDMWPVTKFIFRYNFLGNILRICPDNAFCDKIEEWATFFTSGVAHAWNVLFGWWEELAKYIEK